MTMKKMLAEFNEEDVKALDDALRKFADYKKKRPSGLPDFSPEFAAYTPVLALAYLKAQSALERQTFVLIALTVVLAVLTLGQIILPFIR